LTVAITTFTAFVSLAPLTPLALGIITPYPQIIFEGMPVAVVVSLSLSKMEILLLKSYLGSVMPFDTRLWLTGVEL
jgi:uncharacterized protein YhhL (DUF1145 family)